MVLKIDWFVPGVTPVVSPDRAERAILEIILGIFCPIQAIFAVRGLATRAARSVSHFVIK